MADQGDGQWSEGMCKTTRDQGADTILLFQGTLVVKHGKLIDVHNAKGHVRGL